MITETLETPKLSLPYQVMKANKMSLAAAVSKAFEIPECYLFRKSRLRIYVLPRQCYVGVAWMKYGIGPQALQKLVGFDHATAIYSRNKFMAFTETELLFREKVIEILAMISEDRVLDPLEGEKKKPFYPDKEEFAILHSYYGSLIEYYGQSYEEEI